MVFVASDPSALAAVQQELMAVRVELAERAGTGVQRGTTQNSAMIGQIVGAALLGGLAGLVLLLAVIAIATGDFAIGLVFLLPGLALAAGTALLVRSAVRVGRPAMRERQDLLDREQRLLQQAALVGGGQAAGWPSAPQGAAPYGAAPYGAALHGAVLHGAALHGAGPLPAPPDRQPSAYAQMMHARFPVGRSPERALRELPVDAPAWKVSFHRSLGWGTAVPLVFLLVLVIIPVAMAAIG